MIFGDRFNFMSAHLQLDTECGAQLRKIRLVGAGLNKAEHISARHDQLAFLSRSDLSPKCLQNFPVIDSK